MAISGADTEVQLDENLGAVALQLPPEDLARLDDVSRGLGMFLDGAEFAEPPAKG